jgi:hypothetical protein
MSKTEKSDKITTAMLHDPKVLAIDPKIREAMEKAEAEKKQAIDMEIAEKRLKALDTVIERYTVDESLGYLADLVGNAPQLKNILANFVRALQIVASTRIDSFTINVSHIDDGKNLLFDYKFFKNGERIEPQEFYKVLGDDDDGDGDENGKPKG